MATQHKYIRNIDLKISTDKATYDFSKFKVVFQVIHASISTPKLLKCRIYNLSHGGRGTANTIGDIQKAKNKNVVLQVWYNGGSPAVLFQGQIRMIYAGRETPTETYLEIEATYPPSSWTATQVYNTVLPKKWTHEKVLQETVGKTKGMKVGQLPQQKSNMNGARAKVIYQNGRDMTREVGRNLSAFPVFDDNGNLNFISAQNPKNTGAPIKITPYNGMIGTPLQTPEGIQVTALIDPSFKVGAVIDVYSMNGDDSRTAVQQEEVELNYTGINNGNQYMDEYGNLQVKGLAHNGLYSILFVDHVGDTRGEAWYSTIIGQATDQSDQAIMPNRAIEALVGGV